MCALAIQIPAFYPEVLPAMNPTCSRCRVEMLERPGLPGCYVCPRNPEHTCEVEPMGGGQAPPPKGAPKRMQCVKPEPMPKDNPVIERAFGFLAGHVVPEEKWQRHLQQLAEREPMRLRGPIPQVPQSNASPEYSIMNGPAAPGGGSKSSGRKKHKKPKKLQQDLWGTEGGTKRK